MRRSAWALSALRRPFTASSASTADFSWFAVSSSNDWSPPFISTHAYVSNALKFASLSKLKLTSCAITADARHKSGARATNLFVGFPLFTQNHDLSGPGHVRDSRFHGGGSKSLRVKY